MVVVVVVVLVSDDKNDERLEGGIYTWFDGHHDVCRDQETRDERRYEVCKGQLSLKLICWCGNGGLHGEANNEMVDILGKLALTQLGSKSGQNGRGKNGGKATTRVRPEYQFHLDWNPPTTLLQLTTNIAKVLDLSMISQTGNFELHPESPSACVMFGDNLVAGYLCVRVSR